MSSHTGRRMCLTESTTNEREAERIRTRLLAQVDAKRSTKTRVTLSKATDEWLQVHEIEETTWSTEVLLDVSRELEA